VQSTYGLKNKVCPEKLLPDCLTAKKTYTANFYLLCDTAVCFQVCWANTVITCNWLLSFSKTLWKQKNSEMVKLEISDYQALYIFLGWFYEVFKHRSTS